jgi:hypothetical protein
MKAIAAAVEYLKRHEPRRIKDITFLCSLPSLNEKQRIRLRALVRANTTLVFLLNLTKRLSVLPETKEGYRHVEVRYKKSSKSLGIGRRYACAQISVTVDSALAAHGLDCAKVRQHLDDPKWEKMARTVSYQSMMRELRPVCGGRMLHDCDFVNSIPCVAMAFVSELGLETECSALCTYVANRDSILSDVMEYYRVDRNAAKDLFIRILHGGEVRSWRQDNSIKTNDLPLGRDMPFVTSFHSQVDVLRGAVLDSQSARQDSFGERIRSLCDPARRHGEDIDKVRRSVFAVILQDREDGCLRTAASIVAEHGYMICSLQFDGFLVWDSIGMDGAASSKQPSRESLEATLALVAPKIFAEHGVCLNMIEKPLYGVSIEASIKKIEL